MTRQEMLNVLIEDAFRSFADDVVLEEWLLVGWKGYGKYTDEELKDKIESCFGQKEIEELLISYSKRKEYDPCIDTEDPF